MQMRWGRDRSVADGGVKSVLKSTKETGGDVGEAGCIV